jgi:integrase
MQRSELSHDIFRQTNVKNFLDSIARNSQKSKKAYGTGLFHFHNFLQRQYPSLTLESIIETVLKEQINIYTLFDNFVNYLVTEKKLSPNSISLYVAAIRSYFAYRDVDVVPAKFKRKVRLPKHFREEEVPLDAADIRKILLSCNNRRLKAYLLILASGGMRAMEALTLRIKDLDFSVSPTKIHIRSTKTRTGRDVYISEEATSFLNEFLNYKYRIKSNKSQTPPDDLVFARRTLGQKDARPETMYIKLSTEFNKVLRTVGMDERKEGMLRRKVTLHSLRRHAKTVISDQTNQDYSEWYLGHAGSPYYTKKEADRRELYATKCMKYLTFLDYTTLETTGKNIESKLEEKDKEIEYLRLRDLKHETEMVDMRGQLDRIVSMIQENPKLANVKRERLSSLT